MCTTSYRVRGMRIFIRKVERVVDSAVDFKRVENGIGSDALIYVSICGVIIDRRRQTPVKFQG